MESKVEYMIGKHRLFVCLKMLHSSYVYKKESILYYDCGLCSNILHKCRLITPFMHTSLRIASQVLSTVFSAQLHHKSFKYAR